MVFSIPASVIAEDVVGDGEFKQTNGGKQLVNAAN